MELGGSSQGKGGPFSLYELFENLRNPLLQFFKVTLILAVTYPHISLISLHTPAHLVLLAALCTADSDFIILRVTSFVHLRP